ncbi:13265_t:CDS:2, partial [Funneliformis mosseae]
MQAFSANQTITGDVLKAKACIFAQLLNIEKFSASDDDEKAKLQNIISEYELEN